MPTIDVSDEQRAFLRALRDELQNEVQYGSVREQDALQYLIDHFEGGGDLDVDADVEVEAGSVADASDETSADGGAVTVDATDVDAGTADASADASASDGAGEGDDGDDSESSTGPTPAADGDDDDRLNAMMNLLDTHDGKWREASKEDARYEVDMPDGTTEYVQTKDDVRAHIFKNYD